MKTHPNLKSLVNGVQTAEEMENMIGTALSYQDMFDHRTSPWEMHKWEQEDLQKLKIDLEKVDRLYHIKFQDDEVEQRDYELVARVEFAPKTWMFIELVAGCDYTGFDCRGGGEIYVSFDAQVFLKSVLNRDYSIHRIWQSMVEDDYEVGKKHVVEEIFVW
ncbi:uncharacterized protein LOC121877701 isoform X2 [Homarus americanus]|uniref:uncharacterized protein LOC121877701 isoform X2 n=1 Tax=Homarus americanus TaxID=6706 RepID=UPI001C473A17|nr:uncharacterized protein LOC121877701 isoform X2 [Homarus americanus]